MNDILDKIYKLCFLKIIFPLYYKIFTLKKMRNNILFIEVRINGVSNNFTLLEDYLKKESGYNINYAFLRINSVSNFKYIMNCFDMLRKLAISHYAFINEGSNVVSCIKIRKETKLIQTWHGCGAFKKFGYSMQDKPREQYYNNLHLVTVSSPEVVWAYEESMRIERDLIKPLGVSRTDVFFNEKKMKAYIDNAKKIINVADKKIILYAPTFRENAGNAKISEALDIELMSKTLSSQYILMIKYHPVLAKHLKIPASCEQFVIDVTNNLSIEEAMCISDLCITDYSSLIFEYSLLNKPMIFFAYDLSEYLNKRGFYYDYLKMVPGPICKTTEEIISCIEKIDIYNMKKVEEFREKFMSACDGKATQRILSYIKSSEVLK